MGATVTRRAATAPAVVSATTPLVCASASLATSVPSASTRPSSDKLQDRSLLIQTHLASRFPWGCVRRRPWGWGSSCSLPLWSTLFNNSVQRVKWILRPASRWSWYGEQAVLFDVHLNPSVVYIMIYLQI